jgi:sulfotransferase famil protein
MITPILASIHIPKTAGRSFFEIISSVYPEQSIAHYEQKNYRPDNYNEIDQFKLSLDNKIKVIHGHFKYSDICEMDTNGNMKTIAWLRDPVERVISNFSFFKKRISISPNDIELQKRKNESITEYAQMDNSRNRMSKFLDGRDYKDYFFIGITEHFNEDAKILGEMLNWKYFQIPRINDNKKFKSQLPIVTSNERKLIEDLNKTDMELYGKALSYRKNRIN